MISIIIFLLYLVFFIPLIIRVIRIKDRKVVSFSDIKFPFIIGMIGVIIISIFLGLVNFQVNLLWFKSLGFINAFLKRIWMQFLLYVIGFFFSWLVFSMVFYVPMRREELDIGEKVVKFARRFVPLVLAFIFAGALSSNFMKVFMFLNRTVTTVRDPIFNMSASFYMFTYPLLSSILSYLISIFIVAFIIEELVYAFYIRLNFPPRSPIVIRATNLLAVLGGILFIFFGVRIYLSIYSLLFIQSGAVFGIGYTDYYLRIPIFKILSALFLGGGIFLFVYAALPRFTSRSNVIKILVSGIVIGVLLYGFLPSVFQVLVVKPNELTREKTFLSYNIQGTCEAFGLDKIDLEQFGDIEPLTAEKLNSEKELTDNLRFWDWRALKDTYQQIQAIRLYYSFNDIDVDRYIIGGNLREVLVGAREIDQKLLPDNSKTWVNLHLKYTHGYGICMNTVNEFTPDGLPNLLIKDVPPVSSVPELSVSRPEIYYGELTGNYIFVNTTTPEFDYPKGEDNAYTFYQGDSGISMNPLNRLIFAIQYSDPNIILSRYINSKSKILINRDVIARVEKVAPFLKFGQDPYIVLGDNGKLYWMGDAYTYSSLFPYSEAINFKGDNVNYVRNSIKFVIDAYTGDVNFYIIDGSDVVAETYKKIFPSLFKSYVEMPEFLKKHMRYPDELMETQGYVYSVYHMNDPEVFYNKEDKWTIAQEKYYSATQQVLPYFIVLKAQNSNTYSFVSAYPFTPLGKNNLIALAVAQCDSANYGNLTVYQFSKDKLFYGPMQIEARIDQDSEISKVLTLWNQQGSEVIRGNTLVIPFDHSLLYLEPVYLQASSGRFPQIKKIVLATQNKLVWGDTFDNSVNLLFSEEQAPPQETPSTQLDLLKAAYEHFEKYKDYVSKGEFTLAGKELEELENILKNLTGVKP
jgi:uncharacterized membrane protein (UPF0182 family)